MRIRRRYRINIGQSCFSIYEIRPLGHSIERSSRFNLFSSLLKQLIFCGLELIDVARMLNAESPFDFSPRHRPRERWPIKGTTEFAVARKEILRKYNTTGLSLLDEERKPLGNTNSRKGRGTSGPAVSCTAEKKRRSGKEEL
jgi:hypothetical protein